MNTRNESQVIKRSIVIAGHKTSVSLEDAFWRGFKEVAAGRGMTLSTLVAIIDTERQHGKSVVSHSPVRARFLSQSTFRRKA